MNGRQGKSILDAATAGARLRFRPVMMTSFAFILGLLPLVIAVGAGATSRRAVGTPVFGGMLFASIFGIFIIPMLYVVFQNLRERVSGAARRRPPKVRFRSRSLRRRASEELMTRARRFGLPAWSARMRKTLPFPPWR